MTVAPGTAAALWSRTRPRISAVACCAVASGAARASPAAIAATAAKDLIVLMSHLAKRRRAESRPQLRYGTTGNRVMGTILAVLPREPLFTPRFFVMCGFSYTVF